MSCQPNLLIAPLPADSCLPPELYDYLTNSLSLEILGCGGCVCIVKQTTAPGPEQLDFIWYLETPEGVPLYDLVFYGGEWRRKATVPIGAEVFFSGDPALYFDNVTFAGIHGGEWDGWQIDFTRSAHFPIIAATFSTSGLGWVVNYNATDLNVGGVTGIQLNNSNTYRPATNGLTLYLWEADGNSPGGDADLYGIQNSSAPSVVVLPADPGNVTPDVIPIFPTFVAKSLVVYRGLSAV